MAMQALKPSQQLIRLLTFCLFFLQLGCGGGPAAKAPAPTKAEEPSKEAAKPAEPAKIPPPSLDCRHQKGLVQYWKGTEWGTLMQNDILKPTGEQRIRTGNDGYTAIITPVESDLFMSPDSEVILYPPTLDPNDSQKVIMVGTILRGEVVVSSNSGGMPINAGNFRARGNGGLKIRFDPTAEKGEMALDTGTFDIFVTGQNRPVVKMTGGQAVAFEGNRLSGPKSLGREPFSWNTWPFSD